MKVSLNNLGTVNKNMVTLQTAGGYQLKIWFSYETAVAYQYDNYPPVCSQNEWSRTTGKLLNEIQSEKQSRIPHVQMLDELNGLLQNNL